MFYKLLEQFDFKNIELQTLPLYIASVIVVALIWQLYANAFVAFVWPFWGFHTLLQFFLLTFEILAFASISFPEKWVLGISLTALIGAIIRSLNTRVVPKKNYEREKDFLSDIQIEKRAAKFLFWIFICLLSASLTLEVLKIQQSQYLPSMIVFLGIVVIFITLLLLALGDKDTTKQLQIVFEDSPWAYENFQIVMRESKYNQNDR